MLVQERLDGHGQGGGKGASDQPPKKVAETYEEADRAKPADDSITILGIPIERITSATHAALAGLVAENDYLSNALARHERAARQGDRGKKAQTAQDQASPALLDNDAFIGALGAALARAPSEGASWVVILVHLKTYEILRRSSGLLAANGALDDVGHRFAQVRIGGLRHDPTAPVETSTLSTSAPDTPASLVGQDGDAGAAHGGRVRWRL